MNRINQAYQPKWITQEKLCAINPEGAQYRFNEWNDAAKNHLSQQGFVVIKNILKPEEILHAKCLLWDFLSDLGWERNDTLTWQTRLINAKGIIWGNGAGQSQLQWYIRSRPEIIRTFAAAWSSQDIYAKQGIKFDYKRDIITSMDGFSVFRPWYLNQDGANKWKTQSGWYHIDQNIARSPNMETIQGIVSLYDQDKSTGSTVFVPGSHLWVQQLLPNLSIYKSDFVMIPKNKLDALNKKKILLCCKSGDLIMWDSRCIHCSSPAILSLKEMRRTHAEKLKKKLMKSNKVNITEQKDLENDKENDDEKKKENDDEKIINYKTSKGNMTKTEKSFIESMKDNYLKAKIRRNLDGMMNKIEYNGYIAEVVLWDRFDPKLFMNGKSYVFCLPWNTSLLWIPNWLDRITGNNLKKTILDKVKFERPTLRFDKKNKHGEVIGVKEVKQNRNTAWICNDFNQCVQNRDDTDILPAIYLEEWSNCLLKHASKTSSNEFNAMLMIHYKDGKNSIGLHSDNDYGLGQNAMIGSLSLGSKRTFFIKSKEIDIDSGKKIEFHVPLIHGSFILMNAGFQKFWLHSIPKEKDIIDDRINITFRKYALQKDKVNINNKDKRIDIDIDIDAVNVAPILRGVSYICMTPKLKVKNKGVIRQRIAAYETKSTCSHWPQHCQILHKPLDIKEQSIKNVKDDLIKSLIGLDILTDNEKYKNIKDELNNNDKKKRKGKQNKRFFRKN